jgi:3D (Asp-Asp-Asp) domain-containing protein
MMTRRLGWSSVAWRLRTGGFAFYAGGPDRVLGAAGRSLAPKLGRRPRGRALAIGVAFLIGLPALLWLADGIGSSRLATRTGIIEGRPVGEVASLEGSLERYYRQREAGHWDGAATGREVSVPVVITGYTSRPSETDDTPFVTAANTRTRPGVVALSRDLLRRYTPGAPFEFGDVIHVSGVGDFIVEDSMASRWERRADIWFENLADARAFGRRRTILTGPYGLSDGQTLTHRIYVAAAATGASP